MLVTENYFDQLMTTLNCPFCLFVEDKHYANATARKTLSGLFSSYANTVFFVMIIRLFSKLKRFC